MGNPRAHLVRSYNASGTEENMDVCKEKYNRLWIIAGTIHNLTISSSYTSIVLPPRHVWWDIPPTIRTPRKKWSPSGYPSRRSSPLFSLLGFSSLTAIHSYTQCRMYMQETPLAKGSSFSKRVIVSFRRQILMTTSNIHFRCHLGRDDGNIKQIHNIRIPREWSEPITSRLGDILSEV